MALLPEFFIKNTVAIYTSDINGNVLNDNKSDDSEDNNKNLLGSGFIYGRFVRTATKKLNVYYSYLVTCRHVIEKEQTIHLKFARDDQRGIDIKIGKYNGIINDDLYQWFEHPKKDLDIAIIPFSQEILKKRLNEDYIKSDAHVLNIEKMIEMGVTEGDSIYVLGFPNELTLDNNDLISRTGSIAHIKNLLERKSEEFIIDSFIFPGNSGGPVILKPEYFALDGTKPYSKAFIIGMVKTYYSYQGKAFLREDNGVLFHDNAGLGSIYPIDLIEEVMFYQHDEMTKSINNQVKTLKFHPDKEELEKYILNRIKEDYKDQIRENNKNMPKMIREEILKVFEDESIFTVLNKVHWNDYLKEIEDLKWLLNSPFISDFMDDEDVKIMLDLIDELEKSF